MSSETDTESERGGALEEHKRLPRSAKVGILGGGQLGRMMALAAAKLGVEVMILDPAQPAPASVAAKQVRGSFRERESILELASKVDVLTVEIEHVDTAALELAQAEVKIDVQPTPSTLKTIQDKLKQKTFLQTRGTPLPAFMPVRGAADVKHVSGSLGFPLMLKSRLLAYDGRGNYKVENEQDFLAGIEALTGGLPEGGSEREAEELLYAEQWAPFVKELAVMVARDRRGNISTYPVVETHHRDSILTGLEVPADVPERIRMEAEKIARKAVSHLDGAGVFGVELFLLGDGGILLNEIAPRPHNSGHYTIEACAVGQFEQHIRAVLGWPLGDTSMTCKAASMINVLGEANGPDGLRIANKIMESSLRVPGTHPHWYGKAEVKTGRKIGHITITAQSYREAISRKNKILYGESTSDTMGVNTQPAQVGIIMGSDSDLNVMKGAAQVLEEFGISAEVTIVSAHRTPERMIEYARKAHLRGVKVIIAGAGGAAHLPGMVASLTPLPVIGVPVIPNGAALDGMDSLLSIVQMPKGIPVATVAIQNAANAGLLAVRIIGSSNPEVLGQMERYQEGLKDMVLEKADRLESGGWKNY